MLVMEWECLLLVFFFTKCINSATMLDVFRSAPLFAVVLVVVWVLLQELSQFQQEELIHLSILTIHNPS